MNMAHPMYWVLAVFLGSVALHADRLPLGYLLTPVCCTLWRFMAESHGQARLPPAWLRGLLALALLGGVLLQYRTLNGLGPGTALLVSMGSIKLLETRSRRDHFIMLGVSLFLVLSASLDRQLMLRAPLYLLVMLAACAAMIFVANPTVRLAPRQALRLAGRSFLLAMPLAAVLFMFFPRLSGQLWALPTQGTAVTGLSEEMSPGAISDLSESDEPAFRVRFLGALPPPQQRYWRGPVLHDFDGFTWRRDRTRSYRQTKLEYIGPAYRYRLTLEPHQRNWWFSLEMPQPPNDAGVFFTFDYQLMSAQTVTQATTYELTSYPQTRAAEELSVLGRRSATALPATRNPRARQLAALLYARVATPGEYVQAVLEHFRSGGFSYTLTPDLLQADSIDDFLFNTRSGFCGHFASAFVNLMRAVNVPARVVTGYQGGEWNPIGQYFVVRQSDAHAWAEVWLDGAGWTRVDPTAVVSPERLTRGLFDIMPEAGNQVGRFGRNLPWLQKLRQGWDATNTWWNDRVLEFNLRAQMQLLQRLGFARPQMRQLGYLVAGALALWLAFMLWVLARQYRPRQQDALALTYQKLGQFLRAKGLARQPNEGPSSYADRIRQQAPRLASKVLPLLREYATLRYERSNDDYTARVQSLARQIWRLRLRLPTAGRAAG